MGLYFYCLAEMAQTRVLEHGVKSHCGVMAINENYKIEDHWSRGAPPGKSTPSGSRKLCPSLPQVLSNCAKKAFTNARLHGNFLYSQ